MAKQALVVVHDPGSTSGMLGERLVERGYELDHLQLTTDITNPVFEEPFPDPTAYDLILPMGAVYSVYDTDLIGTWVQREFDFLRAADVAGVPCMGICFGGQMLAAAHGGQVRKAIEDQVGWHQIPSETPSLASGPWLQWHYDSFEAPAEGTVLSKDKWGTQAFTLRRNLGLQFHPEVDGPHLQSWFDYGGVSDLERFDMTAEAFMADTIDNAELARPNTFALVDWFLDDIATAPVAAAI